MNLLHKTGKIRVLQFNIDIIAIAIVEVHQLILVQAEKMIAEDIAKKLGMNLRWLLAQSKNRNIITTITIIGISIGPGKILHPNLAINNDKKKNIVILNIFFFVFECVLSYACFLYKLTCYVANFVVKF